MQVIRLSNQSPRIYRVAKIQPNIYSNNTRNMAFFPRLVATEFAPMFRLLDECAGQLAQPRAVSNNNFLSPFSHHVRRSYGPRFDVKEEKDRYILEGELPGIERQDVQIEFTDSATLSIRGRSENVREEGQKPTSQLIANETEQSSSTVAAATESPDTASTHSRQATVEDDEPVLVESEASEPSVQTPATTQGSVTTETAPTAAGAGAAPTGSKYWISERSVGEFARSFSFPSRIDQENVKASLKNGILSIVVPKASAPVSRRIDVN